jgi:branched-subunit amino acid aminotransferase/4-amino-4-deoxychorismate lyase
VFAVAGGRVHAAGGAALPGVTAARVAALLAAGGVEIEVAPVSADTLAGAEEIFVTSSRRGVTPVVALDGRDLVVGPTTRRAIAAYDAWAAESAAL